MTPEVKPEYESPKPSMRIVDGGGLTMEGVYSLIRDDLGESVSRSAHIGVLNTLTSAQINGSGSTEANTYSLLPKVILHEFQPGRTEKDDYPVHYYPTPDGESLLLTDSENDGPGLYFQWKPGAQETLANLGHPEAMKAASPAQFYLHSTLAPTGERFMSMSEYLLSSDHLELRDLLQIAEETTPESFNKLVDQNGDYYELVEVREETLVYQKSSDDHVVVELPIEGIGQKCFNYLLAAKTAAENPGIHITELQQDFGVLPDSIFLTVAVGIKESLETNSDVVYHVSGTQMHRYLIQSDTNSRVRQERINNLYNEFIQRTGDTKLKPELTFVIIPVASIPTYTVKLEEAQKFSKAIDTILEIEACKKNVEATETSLILAKKKEVELKLEGFPLSEVEIVVMHEYQDLPEKLVTAIIQSYPKRLRADLAKTVVGVARKEKELPIEQVISAEMSQLTEQGVIELIRQKYYQFVNNTEAQKGFEIIASQLKPQVLKQIKTQIFHMALVEGLAKFGRFDQDNQPSEEVLQQARKGVSYNTVYKARLETFDRFCQTDEWLTNLESAMPELTPTPTANEIQHELFMGVVNQVAHKAAGNIVKADSYIKKLSEELPKELEGIREEALKQIG